jgi:phosphate-selective porin OprO and OprP
MNARKKSFGRDFLYATMATAALMMAVPAHAQSMLENEVQALKQQIQELNQQLQSVQEQVIKTQTKQVQTEAVVDQMKRPKATVSTPSESNLPHLTMHGIAPTFSSEDGAYTMSITGRLHFDMGDYVNYSKKSSGTKPNDLNSGVKARRARLGVDGKIANDWGYAFIMDWGGSSADNGSTIENAFVTYNGFAPLHFILGYQDTPYSLDEATSSNDIMFLERASSQAVATGIAANDNRSALGAWWNNDRAWVGVFGTGPTSGSCCKGIPGQLGMTGRATYQVVQTKDATLHLGVDGEALFKPSVTTSSTNTFRNLSLSDAPELRIDNTAILSTGNLGSTTDPVSGANVIGGEVAGNLGPLYGQGEYFHITVNRQGLSDASFDGGYVEASYALTGETKKYNPGSGAYHSISPMHPLSFKTGGWGAWEVAARYSVMDLNDHLGDASNEVAGGKQTVYTFGINWYPNSNMRFMLDYIHGIVDKQTSATNATNIGATVDAIALRTQYNF